MRDLILCLALLGVTIGPSLAAQTSPAAQLTAQNAPATRPEGLLQLPPSNDPGVQKAARLLEQMVQALGGRQYLDIQDISQTGRTFSFYHGESKGTGALYWRFWKWPDLERVELTKQRDWIIVYKGDKAFETTFRGTTPLDEETMTDYMRRRKHSLPWVLKKWLREPGVALLYEGQAMAERKQADQITVLNALNDSVTISIDSFTHLPLKISFTWRDPKSRDRMEDAEGYDGYRSIQGIMTPSNITRYRNGEMVNQRFISSTSYNQGLAEAMFDASPNSAPKGSQEKNK